jgi:hypothetical protein
MMLNTFASFRRRITKSMNRIPSEFAEKKDLIACFNEQGQKPPVYWCFNSWPEAIFLARQLGEDQPLFAMRSLHGFTKNKSIKNMHTNGLGKTYGEQILQLHQEGPIFLGGNCQSGPIAETAAQYLLEKTKTPPVLITLDYQPSHAYPGSVVMLFGSQSNKFNPFLGKEDPVPEWKNKYDNPSWGIIDGAHGKYFLEPTVFQLVMYLEAVTDGLANNDHAKSGPLKIQGSRAAWCP